MSFAEMKELVGETLHLALANGLKISVVVLDVKETYGHIRCLVHPVAGKGQAWVDRNRLMVRSK